MDNKRRKRISNCIKKINEFSDNDTLSSTLEELRTLFEQEEDALSNLPDSLQDTDMAGKIEEAMNQLESAIDSMEEAVDGFETVQQAIAAVIDYLKDIPGVE